MSFSTTTLWLIPALPLAAAAVIAAGPPGRRRQAARWAIGAMAVSLALAFVAFLTTLGGGPEGFREFATLEWMQMGRQSVEIGWILDPLTAGMALMVAFVSLLIFIYSTAYMEHDERCTRFFCFLSLFAAAMLGLVISNSLLLLFICWELVGLASYLLIGFWYHKPAAAAAARKAFITTRIGDMGFLIGMLWLYRETGTLLFYDHGQGCLEQSALSALAATATAGGMALSTAIALLIFCGAIGKSGQLPLHAWLPDAMEGPTPVSALIHAATMVAAGVFLVARMFPLFEVVPEGHAQVSTALQTVAWLGALTAVFAAVIAVTQNDIKRILAYSTVSQLGYMFLGLGVGGVAVGMFHLITHAFFKALLFLGAGSVIHGCHEEQDIRRMGGLWRFMPWTFVTYAAGMLALSGLIPFAGFWSKDGILHAASHWQTGGDPLLARIPFLLAAVGAVLTAFYMTRQMFLVFGGSYRGAGAVRRKSAAQPGLKQRFEELRQALISSGKGGPKGGKRPHESPPAMLIPLQILAACALLIGLLNTPFLPWFHTYLSGGTGPEIHLNAGVLITWILSTAFVLFGFWLGWTVYGRKARRKATEPDPLESLDAGSASGAFQRFYQLAQQRFRFDEACAAVFTPVLRQLGECCDRLDRTFWTGINAVAAQLVTAFAWATRLFDEFVINLGFDAACRKVRSVGKSSTGFQNGNLQHYLRVIGAAVALLVLVMAWGCGAP